MHYYFRLRLLLPLFVFLLVILPNRVTAQEADSQLRLDLTKTRYFLKTEQVDEAFALLAKLKKTHHNNPLLLGTEAEAHIYTGFWKDGLKLLQRAQKRDPQNHNISKRVEEVMIQHGDFLQFGRELIQAGDTSLEQINRIKGRKRLSPNMTLDLLAEHNRLRASSLTTPSGDALRFEGNQERVHLTLNKENDSYTKSELILHAAENVVGLGGRYHWRDRRGTTTVFADINHPNWDFLESIVFEGTKDRLGFSRSHRIMPLVNTKAQFAVQRYGLDGAQDLANSFAINATASYTMPTHNVIDKVLGKDSYASIRYDIDAEYAADVKTRTNSQGVDFQPISLSSREVHTFTLDITKELGKKFRVDGFAGFSADRLGDEGPAFGVSMVYKPLPHIESRLEVSRNISTKKSPGSDNELDRILLEVGWAF